MQPRELVQDAARRAARRRTGVVVGALGRDASTAYAGAGRVRAGGAVPDERTLFEIGSITKVVTGLLLAVEVERGTVDLATPLAACLPEGRWLPTRAGRQITLGHLVTHRSGLPRLPVPAVRGTVEMLRGRDPYAGLAGDDLLDWLGRTPLRREPGTGRLLYSNVGFGLLGRALVHLAGADDFGALVHERVAEPLGLADTATRDRLTEEQRRRLAVGHHRGEREAQAWPLVGLPGCGALLSTATDLLRFARAALDPGTTALAGALRRAQTPQASAGPHLSIAYAWIVDDRLGGVLWHNGGTGGFRSFLGLAPDRGVAAVALANRARSVDSTGITLLRALAG